MKHKINASTGVCSACGLSIIELIHGANPVCETKAKEDNVVSLRRAQLEKYAKENNIEIVELGSVTEFAEALQKMVMENNPTAPESPDEKASEEIELAILNKIANDPFPLNTYRISPTLSRILNILRDCGYIAKNPRGSHYVITSYGTALLNEIANEEKAKVEVKLGHNDLFILTKLQKRRFTHRWAIVSGYIGSVDTLYNAGLITINHRDGKDYLTITQKGCEHLDKLLNVVV